MFPVKIRGGGGYNPFAGNVPAVFVWDLCQKVGGVRVKRVKENENPRAGQGNGGGWPERTTFKTTTGIIP